MQIAYDGYTLVAQRVTYSRASGRVIASGNVEIVEPNGSRIFAEEIDITDDFQDGFVQSLQVETADNTRFAAESAERRDGEIAVFNNGVYTACEPCKDQPEKAAALADPGEKGDHQQAHASASSMKAPASSCSAGR